MEKKVIDKEDNADFNKFKVYEKLLLSTTDLLQDMVQEKINLSLIMQKIRKIITFITYEIHDREKYYIHLISYIHGKNQFNIHSLNTAIISFVIFSLLKKENINCSALLTASLLHDIGKLNYPNSIKTSYLKSLATKANNLSSMHIFFGQRLLLNHLKLSEEIVNLVGNHHERFDGSGFPKGLAGDKLSIDDNIIITANILSNIIQRLNHNGIKALSETVKLMLLKYPNKFEPSIKSILIDLLEIHGKAARKHKRYKTNIASIIEDESTNKRYNCMVYDISTGGMRIKYDKLLPEDAIYKIELQLNENLSMGTKYCNIRWTNKIEDYYEYGISFITPDNKVTEECAKYLE